MLCDFGFELEIYVSVVDEWLRDEVRSVGCIEDDLYDCDVVIYCMSIGSPLVYIVVWLRVPRIVVYHNITSSAYY